MKVKSMLALLGVRPKSKHYGFEVEWSALARDGAFEYAHWLHPREKRKTFSQEQVDALRRFLSPGDTAIDIGAHSGDSTLPIALAVGTKGVVFAIEPNPYVFPILQKNASLNLDKTRVVPLDFAATPEDGEITLEYSDAGYCNGGRHQGISQWKHGHAFKLTVPGRNLEHFLQSKYPAELQRLRYIKIDVEGFDLEVLKSIRALIEKRRPYLKVEVYKHSTENYRRELVRFLQDLRYNVRRVVSDSNLFGDEIMESNVTSWAHYDILAVPAANFGA